MSNKYNLSTEQDTAANPTQNVWVQANAGTGKTSVLIQRLMRILFRTFNENSLRSGILCLTYTNAAASEMRNRILKELSKWATAKDKDLAELLIGISINKKPDNTDLQNARKIFYNYIDNPDILKIKTIHGFCEEVLRRFPLEAGVSPAWKLISDTNQKILLSDTFHNLINHSKDASAHNAFTHIVGRISENNFDELLYILTKQYKHFFQIDDIYSYRQYFIENITESLELNNQTNTNTNTTKENLINIVNIAEEDLNSSKKPEKTVRNTINTIKQHIDNSINFEEYKKSFLKQNGEKNTTISKKDYLKEEQDRVYKTNQKNLNQQVYDDTIALFDLSAAFAENYKKLKHSRNLLDFDDLILYTLKLFSRPDLMGWVLSQLDIQLSHILVDEAQDTSPEQWEIMKILSGDFFTDGNKEINTRSLFVVGDTKQSIYGFQGTDPESFAKSRDAIAENIQQNLRSIKEIPLTQSFRSAPTILNTLDTFFGDERIRKFANFTNNKHACFRKDVKGIVELHPFKTHRKPKDKTDQKNFQSKKDYIKSIADKIQTLITTDNFQASDIMVLVQQRNPFSPLLVKELKSRNIDVAGSDRIVLPKYPAIRDLLNLVRFCLDNNDDYSLSCTLKSPFYRLKEQNILNICKLRTDAKKTNKNINLFNILETEYPEIFAQLFEISEFSKTLAPYSFFTKILNTYNKRKEMISALGSQIIDPLEEFMTICLSYERTQAGTLKHFLKWFITSSSEIKRDMDASAGVRIVTIHGSKGLEAPVVFLIDTIKKPKTEKIISISSAPIKNPKFSAFTPWLWTPKTNKESEKMAGILDVSEKKQIAEYYRLLYVAMTRARDRLYIYGLGKDKNPSEISWHTKLTEILSNDDNIKNEDNIIRICND